MNGQLPQVFASLFSAQRALAQLRSRTRLPTFNLTTTSLRHSNMWFDRLYDIDRGIARAHGNYFSDPASVGLVDRSARPYLLTPAGRAFLSFRRALHEDQARAEYELLRILYFGGYNHQPSVQQFLASKRGQLFAVLDQFAPWPTRHLFLTHPRLLVVAELIAGFPGAIPRLLALPERHLLDMAALGEHGFANLCSGQGFTRGLARLCRRIGSDYTRAEERRLHYVVSMALLAILQTVPRHRAVQLRVPPPYCNLLTEMDVYNRHAHYTTDMSVWFDGVNFQVSSSLATPPGAPLPPPAPLQFVTILPQIATPSGTGSAPANHQSRRARRGARRTQVNIILDPVLSERAEDVAEERILRPQHGPQLVRVGHRRGETIALPDGIVPGADFYVIDASSEPIEFTEVKSVSGNPPFDVALTRAEYLRAVRCAAAGTPYRLVLVDVGTGGWFEVRNVGSALAALQLGEAVQFVIRISA